MYGLPTPELHALAKWRFSMNKTLHRSVVNERVYRLHKSRDTTSWKWHWFSQLGRRSSFKMLRFTSSNTCFRRYPSTHIERHLYLLNFVMCVRDKSCAERNRSLVMFCMCLLISWCICSYILNTPNWLNIKVSLWKISVSSIIFKKIDNKSQW